MLLLLSMLDYNIQQYHQFTYIHYYHVNRHLIVSNRHSASSARYLPVSCVIHHFTRQFHTHIHLPTVYIYIPYGYAAIVALLLLFLLLCARAFISLCHTFVGVMVYLSLCFPFFSFHLFLPIIVAIHCYVCVIYIIFYIFIAYRYFFLS